MNQKKKLLVLTPRFPYPVIGGDRLRIYNLCKALSEHFDICLLSLCESVVEMSMTIPCDGVFARVERVYLPRWKSYINCLFSLPSRVPLQVAYYRSNEFREKVNMLLPESDIALAHLIRTGEYLKGNPGPKVLEMTDAISMNYERVKILAKFSGIKSRIFSIEGKRLRYYERSIVDDFDLSVLVSEIDKNYLFMPGDRRIDRVLICSNGVDLASLPYEYKPTARTIAFIGNMNSVQNMDAARWFANEIMPRLLTLGDFHFKVVGRIPESDQNELNHIPGVTAVGTVDSVAEAVKGAFLGVCPMRLGAGVQNKVLEYMALGLPVVSTRLGHEGIGAKAGTEIVIADTVQDFVENIMKLSADNEACSNLSHSGRMFVEQHHEWLSVLEPFVTAVVDLASCSFVKDDPSDAKSSFGLARSD